MDKLAMNCSAANLVAQGLRLINPDEGEAAKTVGPAR
jgi:hypothetical protein